MNKEMEKSNDVIMNTSNINTRNKIQLVKANINDNKNDNINELSKKTGQYLTKKSYNKSLQTIIDTIQPQKESAITHSLDNVVSDDENIPQRPLESDFLYNDSDNSE